MRIHRTGSRLVSSSLVVVGLLGLAACSGGGGGTSPSLASIQVTPANREIAQTSPLQFAASGVYGDGTTKDVTSQVTWASAAAAVATISATGLATAGAVGTTTISATLAGISGATGLTVTGVSPIPDPPPDDAAYFQVLIDNRVTAGQTVHLTATANQLLLTSPDIEQVTWLTGGGPQFDDWTIPMFQIVDSLTGSTSTGASFTSTYDVTLDKLPLDASGLYRVMKIPFLKPGDPTRSLGGSGHLTITLGGPATMQINASGNPGGYAIAMPSPDPAGAGGQQRWDFVEFNCATPQANGKSVCFVNTTNVDFFSLGLTIKGRSSGGTTSSFGLELGPANPVSSTIAALEALPADYTAGKTYAGQTFLRYRAPGMSFTPSSTALNTAIDDGYAHYATTTLQFSVSGVPYTATTVGSALVFTQPVPFSIAKPTSQEVAASTGPLDVAGKGVAVQNGIKFVDAYLNRGVFQNAGVWTTPTAWYPVGGSFNQYSLTLHNRFILGATYGFSFDDVPSGGVMSVPAISTCTSMSLVLTDD